MIQLFDFERDGDKQVGMVKDVALELCEGWDHDRRRPQEPIPFTQLVGAAPTPFLLTARIEFEGMLSAIGSALGAQDVETGDEELDEMLVIKSSDEPQVLELLTPEARAAFKRVPDTVVVDYKDGLITAKWWGHEQDRRLLHAVADLVVALGVASPPAEPAKPAPRARRVSPRAERRRRLREALKDSE
ncbi:MAG: hypothetical protein JNK04_25355 [Myxococcales bacterium]|nr:hypothetical protein [Myxococcales bacterium]